MYDHVGLQVVSVRKICSAGMFPIFQTAKSFQRGASVGKSFILKTSKYPNAWKVFDLKENKVSKYLDHCETSVQSVRPSVGCSGHMLPRPQTVFGYNVYRNS